MNPSPALRNVFEQICHQKCGKKFCYISANISHNMWNRTKYSDCVEICVTDTINRRRPKINNPTIKGNQIQNNDVTIKT